MSVKRPGSPLESIAQAQRVEASASAAASSQCAFDRLPDEMLDHIFSFLPKETCGAVSLVDRRFNHVMADHYAIRAIRSLDFIFRISLPRAFQRFAEEGDRGPLEPNLELEGKLLKMSRQDQRVRVAIHEESIAKLHRFIADCSAVKGLAIVDAARSHELPAIKLTPLSIIDPLTGEIRPVTGTVYENRLTFIFDNTETVMK